ncbi:AMP-dependent synthetase/ligase [Fusarium oxysporum f. sp. vasinfectum]|nr:AMP-dependent synthetase/ligase [Fusarium oxysporum f. sp. vasinfectum]
MMDGDQILMIYHTSGSTSGAPKLVPITARWMECLIKKFSSFSEFLPLPRAMVKVAIGSSTHMGSTMLFLESDLQGGCFIIPTSIPYPTSELVDMIDNHGLTRLDMFPVFLSQLFRQARHDPLLFRSLCLLDHIAYGGYPLDPYEEAWAHGHNFYLISAFGFTEVGLNLISYGAKEVALGPVSPSIFEFVPLGDDQNAQEHLVELAVPLSPLTVLTIIALGEYAFRGRDDDWVKMEMALRCDANSIEVDALQCCGDDLIHAVVAIGVGRPSPAIVLGPKHDDVLESTEKTRELQLKVLQRITPFHRRRHKHERIEDVNLIFVVPQRSLPRTDTKGNIRRLKVEEQFKQKLDEMFK